VTIIIVEIELEKILGIIACDYLQFYSSSKYQKLKYYTSLLFVFKGQKFFKNGI